MQVKKHQLELDMQQLTGSKLGKEYVKGCILSLCLFNLYAEYIMQSAGLDEKQAGINIVIEISITSDIQMIPPLRENEEKLKSILMKVKEEIEKAHLKLSIQKTKTVASGPLLHGKYMGKQWEQ